MATSILQGAARFHLSRPLRRCRPTLTMIPQSIGVKFSLAKDINKTVFVMPMIPSYTSLSHRQSTTTPNSGAGIWVTANRRLLESFTARHKTRRNGDRDRGLRGVLLKVSQHQFAENLCVDNLVLHSNLLNHIERSIVSECHAWYMRCCMKEHGRVVSSRAVLQDLFDDDIFEHVRQRSQALEMSSLSWDQEEEEKEEGSRRGEDMSLVELDDPRIGLVVAFQRMDVFRW